MACVFLAVVACGQDRQRGHAFPIPGEGRDRVIVEVLNTTDRAGLARTATRVLRQAGLDVVFYGNAAAGAAPLDTTRILVRRGSASSGERVRRALGTGKVGLEPDTARLLDVSVFLGLDFRPSAFDFHP